MRLDELRTMTVATEKRIATLTLQNPEALNAVGPEMHRELAWVFRALADDPESDIIVLTGAGRAFCAGGNFEWMQWLNDDPVRFIPIIDEIKHIVLSMLELPKPMICRMNGDAVGLGATLALCCDMIVAADTARFGDPHVRVGLAAGDGAAIVLPQVIGYMRAKELMLTGDLLSAADGKAMGLINHVVPADELDAKVQSLAEKLGRGAQQAIRFTKTALNAGLREAAQKQLDMLGGYQALSVGTPDHREALAAMRDGRRPSFGAAKDG